MFIKNAAHGISVPSAVKVGGDLMEAIKGTELRDYPLENEAHGM
jgi:hypothetical protein